MHYYRSLVTSIGHKWMTHDADFSFSCQGPRSHCRHFLVCRISHHCFASSQSNVLLLAIPHHYKSILHHDILFLNLSTAQPSGYSQTATASIPRTHGNNLFSVPPGLAPKPLSYRLPDNPLRPKHHRLGCDDILPTGR